MFVVKIKNKQPLNAKTTDKILCVKKSYQTSSFVITTISIA